MLIIVEEYVDGELIRKLLNYDVPGTVQFGTRRLDLTQDVNGRFLIMDPLGKDKLIGTEYFISEIAPKEIKRVENLIDEMYKFDLNKFANEDETMKTAVALSISKNLN